MKNTVVQENGKVVTECDDINQHFHFPLDYFEVKSSRPLRLKKKLYEFYTAPITKFWGHSVSDRSSTDYFLLNCSNMPKL
jgi:transient receptor potential cation channel subfamily M protein 3